MKHSWTFVTNDEAVSATWHRAAQKEARKSQLLPFFTPDGPAQQIVLDSATL